ncbi:hypothetical protein ACIBEH_13580 [Nocardia salmonicida]|uniref:hypothetical protein n=1 Tax=Nocardia salmonicida TaxID=53431 RepID=UPI0037A7F49D
MAWRDDGSGSGTPERKNEMTTAEQVGGALSTDTDYGFAADEVADDRDRLVGDLRLYDRLEAGGFRGPDWTASVITLVKHGSVVLDTWSRSGRIWSVLWDKGFPLTPAASEDERRRLAVDELHRRDIVHPAVAAAAVKVQKDLQAGIGWLPGPGRLSLKSYFVGSCTHSFLNEFRKYRRQQKAIVLSDSGLFEWLDVESLSFDRSNPVGIYPDPEIAVLERETIREHMNELDEIEKTIVWAKVLGHTAVGISELLDGELSPKAVAHRWERLQRRVDWIGRLGSVKNT